MNKIARIAWANINQSRSMSIALVVMFIVAALMLNAGMLILIDYGGHFKAVTEELSTGDAVYLLSENLQTSEVSSFFRNNPHITSSTTEKARFVQATFTAPKSGVELDSGILFYDMDIERTVSRYTFIGPHLAPADNAVYLPFQLCSSYGYALGDTITLSYPGPVKDIDIEQSFIVSGFIEDGLFMSQSFGIMSFYVPPSTFKNLDTMFGGASLPLAVTFITVDDVENLTTIESDVRDLFPNQADLHSVSGESFMIAETFDMALVTLARTMMAMIVSLIMVAFAVIIVIVCLIVVYFRITNSIEEDMLKIGSLKSTGFTSAQIISSILLQFALLSGVGSVGGIVVSYPLLPFFASILEAQSGLLWVPAPNVAISSAVLATLALLSAVVVTFAARHIRSLTPTHALRGQSRTTRTTSKNRLPLDRTSQSLPLVLGLKSAVQNPRQTIMIAVILTVVSIVGVFGIIMYYNSAVDTTAFATVPGNEIANVFVAINPASSNRARIIDEIKATDGVRKVAFDDSMVVSIDGIVVPAAIRDDYETKESRVAYEGRYPEASGEITIHGALSDKLGKTVGDTVTLTEGRTTLEMRIVGLQSGMNGFNASLLLDDYRKLNPTFVQTLALVYLDEGFDAAQVTSTLAGTYKEADILQVMDGDKMLEEGMSSYTDIIRIMGILILVIMLCVIALVLYFVISASIVRRRRELGIHKAIGFSTLQLMHQFSISFMIPVIVGSVLGAVIGARYTNALLATAVAGGGVIMPDFLVNTVWVIAFCASLIGASYALALLITWRIRKISAYALVTE